MPFKNDSTTSNNADHMGSHFAEPEKKQHEKHSKKPLVVVLCVLAAIYLVGAIFFRFCFYPNTTIGDEDVSMALISAERDEILGEADSYSIDVTGDGLDLTIKGSDIELAVDGDGFVSDIVSQQNPWAWPLNIFGTHEVSLPDCVSYDESKLEAALADPIAAVNETATPTTDATIAYDDASGAFKIVEEVYGTQLDATAVAEQVGEAISALDSSVTLGKESLTEPAVSSDDERLKTALEEANSYVSLSIPLNFNGTTVYTIDGATIKDFVKLDDDLNVTIDQDALSTWVNDTLSPALNTVGSSRSYTRPDGKAVTVTGGDYGWAVDVSSSAGTIADAINNKDNTAIELSVTQSAQAWNGVGQADWGSTYVDVDLTEQHARFYKDGELVWESDFVSGNTSKGYGTPEGVYDLNNKALNQTLIGADENDDDEPDYKTPVTYWMPFVDNSVGFHDAYWRSSFGGTIYTYNGSHGCVNLPTSAAQSLYDLIEVGTVVVVHW
jgi:hypothetical protein